MPRLNSGSELYKYLNNVYKFVIPATTHGDTTTSGAIAAAVDTVDITATTNFSDGDYVVIDGDGGMEVTKISGSPATNDCPLDRPLLLAQSSGARFVEVSRIDIGHVAEGGMQFGGSLTLTPIKAATSRTAIAFFADAAELTWSIPLLGFNNLNLQSIFGATEGESGTGTASDPYAVAIGTDTVGTQGILCLRAVGVTQGGQVVEQDFLDCTVEVNTNVTIGAAQPDGMTYTGKCSTIIQRIWTP